MTVPDPTPSSTPNVPAFADLATTRCEQHAARFAVALCRTCLSPRCGECLVKVDGVNHCAACQARLFPPSSPVHFRPESGGIALSLARALLVIALYSVVALVAIGAGVAFPFFANERLLAANRERMTEVHLNLSAYFADVRTYPDRERGLVALLVPGPDDRDSWRGPYTTARARDGRSPRNTADEGKVLDVFGRPVVYWASGDDDEDGVPDLVYIASPGANGTFETPGVHEGKAPRDESGDDVVQWVVWP